MRVSFLSNKSYKSGQVVNLLYQISNILFLPLQLIVGFVVMYKLVGNTFIVGVVILMTMGFFNFLIGKY